jgi:uncharacterized protein involved in oxidation of intracellular sulfur
MISDAVARVKGRLSDGTTASIASSSGFQIARLACWASCLDALWLQRAPTRQDARRSALEQLTEWTLWADRTLTF